MAGLITQNFDMTLTLDTVQQHLKALHCWDSHEVPLRIDLMRETTDKVSIEEI